MFTILTVITLISTLYLLISAITILCNIDEECYRNKIYSKLSIDKIKELLKIDSYWRIFDAILISVFFLMSLIKSNLIFDIKVLSKISPISILILSLLVFIIGNILFYKRIRKI